MLASSDGRHAKALIEQDRNYARKSVVSESDLESILTYSQFSPVAPPTADVLAIWTQKLDEVHLYKAVFGFGDNKMPDRLRAIEEASLQAATGTAKIVPRLSSSTKAAPFLRELRLNNYREYPCENAFEFGTVNLIVGINGTGKTSLLEAIELAYCGAHNRGTPSPANYALGLTWADGKTEVVDHRRILQPFRDSNLLWYGRTDVKTNTLVQSFSKYNFLNTDAAVSLATSTERLEEDLSKLLVGGEAARTWRVIEDLYQHVGSRVQLLQQSESSLANELDNLAQQKESGLLDSPNAVGLLNRLQEHNQQLGWSIAPLASVAELNKDVNTLQEFVALLKQICGVKWLSSPASADRLANFGTTARTQLAQAEPAIHQWRNVVAPERARLRRKLTQAEQALELAQQLRQILATKLVELSVEREQQQRNLSVYATLLADLPNAELEQLVKGGADQELEYWQQVLAAKVAVLVTKVSRAKTEYEQYTDLRKQSMNLAQQMRQLAKRLLEGSSSPDQCPLCHTTFESGKLAQHIALDMDGQQEIISQGLLKQVQELEHEAQSLASVASAANWLATFCTRASLPPNILIEAASLRVRAIQETATTSTSHLAALTDQIALLAASGITLQEAQKIRLQLMELGYPTSLSESEVANTVKTIERTAQQLANEANENAQTAKELAAMLAQSLAHVGSLDEFVTASEELKSRIAVAENLNAKLIPFLQRFLYATQTPLSSLLLEAELILGLMVEWQLLRHKDDQNKRLWSLRQERESVNNKELKEVRLKLDRFLQAQETLKSILHDYSLTDATEAALKENREGIEAAFKRIHSPNEFSVIKGKSNAAQGIVLLRDSTGVEANLNQISTGQRAAFALSVFLAQNARLQKNAPPVILIDDPVAHVDDLNALSFIDYLREIVINTKRQLFFATADEKLGSLIAKKFAFLGNEFKTINLVR